MTDHTTTITIEEFTMTDTSVEIETETEETTVVKIPISKAGMDYEVNTGEIPIELYTAALQEGLKVFLSKGLTAITKTKHPDPEALRAAAQAQVEKNLAAIKDGSFRLSGRGSAKSKISGVLKTEAMAIAKKLVKAEIKRQGQRVGAYTGREITAYAQGVLDGEQGPGILKLAEAQLKERDNAKIDIHGAIGGLLKTGEEVKAKPRKAPLSAKQAAMPTMRTGRGDVRPTQR